MLTVTSLGEVQTVLLGRNNCAVSLELQLQNYNHYIASHSAVKGRGYYGYKSQPGYVPLKQRDFSKFIFIPGMMYVSTLVSRP